ncbi:MAG: hypothetical protein IKH96_00120 [Ruminococcus sp.]|uniref:hypothetical protein n=1 Tax=Ruminococcus sp. TaxID=41978 RepID=UPI0025FD1006|nr:hypothetical protein [Ruminococcus sp.]MBR6994402.1 hypothetical protein [Ruminococcus sp.]
MKKELSAAVLFAALLTSCNAQQSSLSEESADTTASVSTAESTTAAANTTETTTYAAGTTETATVTTTVPPRRTMHTDLCNTITAEDEPNAEEDIKGITLTSLNFYPGKEAPLPYEPTDSEKQLIQDYIISHDLSPVDDTDYHFFDDQESPPDYSQVAFYASVSVPRASGDHMLAFSKDMTVIGVKWSVAEGGGGNYYLMEDAEQLQPIFAMAEQYTAGELS